MLDIRDCFRLLIRCEKKMMLLMPSQPWLMLWGNLKCIYLLKYRLVLLRSASISNILQVNYRLMCLKEWQHGQPSFRYLRSSLVLGRYYIIQLYLTYFQPRLNLLQSIALYFQDNLFYSRQFSNFSNPIDKQHHQKYRRHNQSYRIEHQQVFVQQEDFLDRYFYGLQYQSYSQRREEDHFYPYSVEYFGISNAGSRKNFQYELSSTFHNQPPNNFASKFQAQFPHVQRNSQKVNISQYKHPSPTQSSAQD